MGPDRLDLFEWKTSEHFVEEWLNNTFYLICNLFFKMEKTYVFYIYIYVNMYYIKGNTCHLYITFD